jgi:hypothetical protein
LRGHIGMIIRNPYFTIGEKVLIQSKVQPQFNGEYHIESIQYYMNGHVNSEGTEIPPGYYYYIAETLHQWSEASLKKIHTGTGGSYKDMISGLKGNILK